MHWSVCIGNLMKGQARDLALTTVKKIGEEEKLKLKKSEKVLI